MGRTSANMYSFRTATVALLGALLVGSSSAFTVSNRLRAAPSAAATLSASCAEAAMEPPEPESAIGAVLEPVADVVVLGLRLGTCALMIHHGFDKVQNVDGFSANVVAKFFGFLPGDPKFWTLSAAGTQIAGAVLLSLGLFSRPVAASMSATMITAVVFHLLNTGPEAFPLGIPKAHSYNFELAAMYVFVLGYFSVAGAGKYSIDEQVLGGELNFYSGLLDKAFGGEEEE